MASEDQTKPTKPRPVAGDIARDIMKIPSDIHTKVVLERFKFGDLNPAQQSPVSEALDLSTSTYQGVLKKAAIESTRHNVLANQHIFKAIVLYAWQSEGPSSEGFLRHFPEITDAVHVKARIPEIHTVPYPTNLPLTNDPHDKFADWSAINAHPTFVARDTIISQYGLPAPGSIVYVTFESFDPFQGPIYLGKVNETQTLSTLGAPGLTAPLPTADLPDVDVDLSSLEAFDPNGKKVEDMFSRNKYGTNIRTGLGKSRLTAFMKDLENHLNSRFPGKNYQIKSNGNTRPLEKATKAPYGTISPGRTAGSLHGLGLALDMNVVNDVDFRDLTSKPSGMSNRDYKYLTNKGYTREPKNVTVRDLPGLAEAINEYCNSQPDISWGGYFKYKSKREVSPQKLFDAKRKKERFIYAGEIHHYELTEEVRPIYWKPWLNVLAQLGIKKIPVKSADRHNFYKKVLQYFNDKEARA